MKTTQDMKWDGCYNFRDMGGYRSMDGRRVVYGKLFRSDELSKLSEHDMQQMQELGIKTIIDYRNVKEREGNEDRVSSGMQIHYLDPKADVAAFASKEFALPAQHSMEELTAEKAWTMMVEQNRQFVLSSNAHRAYRKMFDLLAEEKNLPLVQHCRGGKDRTGFGCALLLLALGVSKEDVLHDYLLTNVYKKEKNEKSLKEVLEHTHNEDLVLALRYLKEANRAFIETAFTQIKLSYGSTTSFLVDALGLMDSDIEHLKDLYLEEEVK